MSLIASPVYGATRLGPRRLDGLGTSNAGMGSFGWSNWAPNENSPTNSNNADSAAPALLAPNVRLWSVDTLPPLDWCLGLAGQIDHPGMLCPPDKEYNEELRDGAGARAPAFGAFRLPTTNGQKVG